MNVRHYKLSQLPDVWVPDAFYWILNTNGNVDGYLTDHNGVPRKIEGAVQPIQAVAANDLIVGTPVAIDRATGKFIAADAVFKPHCFVVGLLAANVAAGFVGNAEPLRLMLADWTAIAGTPTLAPGVNYFLNSGGGLITNPPAGACVVLVGKSLDTVTFLIDVQPPIEP